MSFRPEHEIHRRRLGRNLGLGICLVSFVAIVFGLTIAKVSTNGFSVKNSGVVSTQGNK